MHEDLRKARAILSGGVTELGDSEAVKFFYENNGFSYNPKTETRDQGRWNCARECAAAEKWLHEQPCHGVEWSIDPDNVAWLDCDHAGPLWQVVVRVGEDFESCGGVDFGADGNPSDPYARCLVADLAIELMRRISK